MEHRVIPSSQSHPNKIYDETSTELSLASEEIYDQRWKKKETAIVTVGFTNADYIVDGTADNVQIQLAIDEVVDQGGGIVFLQEGSYNINSRLSFGGNNVILTGSGVGATTLKLQTGTSETYILVDSSNLSNITVENITFDANGETDAGLLVLQGILTNVNIHRNEFKNVSCSVAPKWPLKLGTVSLTTGTISAVNTSTDVLTVGANIPTGTPILFTTTGTLPTGLSTTSSYYAINASSTTIKVATSVANANAGTAVDISGSGSGTNSFEAANYAASQSKNVRVEHNRFVDNNPWTYEIILAVNMRDSWVQHNYFAGNTLSSSDEVSFYPHHENTVYAHNIHFNSNAAAFGAKDAVSVSVHDNLFWYTSNSGEAVNMRDTINSSVHNNVFFQDRTNTSRAVGIEDTSGPSPYDGWAPYVQATRNLTVRGNRIYGFNYGVEAALTTSNRDLDLKYVTIENNDIDGAAAPIRIGVSSSSVDLKYWWIRGNKITNWTGANIGAIHIIGYTSGVGQVSDIYIEDNYVQSRSSGTNGSIRCVGATIAAVTGNTITTSGSYGATSTANSGVISLIRDNIGVSDTVGGAYKVEVVVGPAGSSADYVCDGTADESEINSAITLANAAGGGIVRLKKGTYTTAASIILKSNVTLIGEGVGATIITGAASDYALVRTTLSGTTKTVYTCISVRDITFKSAYGTCLSINNTNIVNVTGNEFYFTSTSPIRQTLFIQHCKNIFVDGNYAHDYTGNGLSVTSSDYFTISNNIVVAGTNGDDGIDVDYDFLDTSAIHSTYGTIVGNVVKDVGRGNGIRVENSDWITVTGNTVSNVTPSSGVTGGILINTSTTNTGKHISVVGNTVSNCVSCGIAVDGTNLTEVIVTGNTIEDCGQSGGSNPRAGILLGAVGVLCSNNIIENTAKSGADGGGILVYKKDSHIIQGNIIKGCVTGLRLWNGDALQSYTSLLIIGNRFDSNTAAAVTTAATSASRIFNNYGLSDFDATTTAKGVIQLAGDLAGTAAAPTVPTKQYKVGLTIGPSGSNADYICDGTADNADFTSAISALPSTGGRILVKNGTYNFSGRVTLTKSNVTIEAESKGGVTIKAASSLYSSGNDHWLGMFRLQGQTGGLTNIILRGIIFDCNSQLKTQGVSIDGGSSASSAYVDDVLIENCKFINMGAASLETSRAHLQITTGEGSHGNFGDVSNITIRGSVFGVSQYYHIYILGNNLSRFTLEHSLLEDCGWHSVSFYQYNKANVSTASERSHRNWEFAHNHWRNNRLISTGGNTAALIHDANRTGLIGLNVHHNHFEGNVGVNEDEVEINIHGAWNVNISDNFFDQVDQAVSFGQSNAGSYYKVDPTFMTVVARNFFYRCRSLMDHDASNWETWDSNFLYECGHAGFTGYSRHFPCTYSNNKIYNTPTYYLDASEYRKAAIALNGDGFDVRNNIIVDDRLLYDPPSAPTLSQVAGGALGARTYYVKHTFENDTGETLASAESTLAISANNLLKVTIPTASADSVPPGAKKINIYVSTTTNTETLQDYILLATHSESETTHVNRWADLIWTEPTTGLVVGTALPVANTTETLCKYGIFEINGGGMEAANKYVGNSFYGITTPIYEDGSISLRFSSGNVSNLNMLDGEDIMLPSNFGPIITKEITAVGNVTVDGDIVVNDGLIDIFKVNKAANEVALDPTTNLAIGAAYIQGLSSTGLSDASNGKIYMDSDDNKMKLSVNGGAFENIATEPFVATSIAASSGSALTDLNRKRPFIFSDFLAASTNQVDPFLGTVTSSGTLASPSSGTISAHHPGAVRFASSVTPNSGAFVGSNTNQLLLGGGEVFDAIFRLETITLSIYRIGLHDTTTNADPVDGAYVEIDGSGIATGKTSNNSARSSTGTTYTLSSATWYRIRIIVNSNASQIDYYIYDDSGTLLWNNNLTTNIPTASGRETGLGVQASNSGSSAVGLITLDFMALGYASDRTR